MTYNEYYKWRFILKFERWLIDADLTDEQFRRILKAIYRKVEEMQADARQKTSAC